MITVIIPTANRPGFLREALRSVGRQTAIHRIDCILVSDNSGIGNRESDGVVNEFKRDWLGIPVHYAHRGVKISACDHGRLIFGTHHDCVFGPYDLSPYTAILHDDDWWGPDHISKAVAALEKYPAASFYGCNQFDVTGPSSLLYVRSNIFPWFALGYPELSGWVLDSWAALIAQTMGGLCHYSGMVIKTEALKAASWVFDLPNATFDSDRMIQFMLSQRGQVLYNPIPQIFVRQHASRECVASFTREQRLKHFSETTEWILKEAGAGKGLLESFGRRLDVCPVHARSDVREAVDQPWCLPVVERHARTLTLATL